MDKHLNHVKDNMFYCKNATNKFKDFNFELFAFDTESCTDKENDDTGARVYAWSLGACYTATQVYGNNLSEFYDTLVDLGIYHFKNLFDGKAPKGKNKEIIIKLPIGVHNLAWDLEFLKYFLEDEKEFKYNMGVLTNVYKPTPYETIEVTPTYGEYNIVQNDGIVYACEFCFLEIETETPRGKKFTVKYVADMWDTLKVMTCSINKIDSFCTDIDPMFKKLGDTYDYELWRSPSHVLTDLELQYLYNDVYRLSKALEQFFLSKCKDNNISPLNCRTASSMAFAVLKNMTFKDEEYYKKYYGIGEPCTYDKTRERLERLSYQGGYTHINKDIINKEIPCDGSSFDINSSYPSQMAYELLPYGSPVAMEYGFIPSKLNNIDHVGLIEIGFDYVEPKDPSVNLPIFKIGVRNLEPLEPIVGKNISGNEYFSTNIYNDEVIDVFATSENENMITNYNKVVTSVEYDFLIKNYKFGKYGDRFSFSGLEIGNVIVYKAEKGKLKNFIEHFTKMKVLYKGTSKEEINNLLATDKDYFNGILNEFQLVNATKEGIKKDDSLIAFAKLCLNSSYGKFGSKSNRIATNTITDKHGIKRFTTPSDDEYVCIDYNAKEYYRPVASFITAYGRLKIWNTIIALGVENFLYTDTDSIYQRLPKGQAIEILNKAGQFVDPKKLGYWDNEHNFVKFKGLSQKKYMLEEVTGEIDCRCSGCPHDVQKELCKQGFKEFYLGKEIEGKKQKVKVVGGVLLKDVKFSISSFSF